MKSHSLKIKSGKSIKNLKVDRFRNSIRDRRLWI